MTRFKSTIGRATLILLLGATASACSQNNRVLRAIDRADQALTMKAKASYSMHLRAQAPAGTWRATVAYRKGSSKFARGGRHHVRKFVRTTTPMSHEWVSVAIPAAGKKETKALAVSRAKRISRALAHYGVKNTRITFNSDVAGAAVLTFHRARAMAVSCPEWRDVVKGRRIKFNDWKFGCATAGALGASAYSRDLSHPGHLAKSTGDEAAAVAKADRDGDLDPGQDSSGSEATTGGE